jgi:hypothetical protein
MKQVAPAVQQVASSAMKQVAPVVQQVASSAIQQVASTQEQEGASAIQQQAFSGNSQKGGVSGATIFKTKLIDEMKDLRLRVSELLNIVYSPESQYPLRTRDGTLLSNKEYAIEELTEAFLAVSRKQTEILTMDSFAREFDSTYEDHTTQPVLQDNSILLMKTMVYHKLLQMLELQL